MSLVCLAARRVGGGYRRLSRGSRLGKWEGAEIAGSKFEAGSCTGCISMRALLAAVMRRPQAAVIAAAGSSATLRAPVAARAGRAVWGAAVAAAAGLERRAPSEKAHLALGTQATAEEAWGSGCRWVHRLILGRGQHPPQNWPPGKSVSAPMCRPEPQAKLTRCRRFGC